MLGIVGLVCCGFIAGIPAIILVEHGQEGDRDLAARAAAAWPPRASCCGVLAVIWGVIYLILAATGNFSFDFSTST